MLPVGCQARRVPLEFSLKMHSNNSLEKLHLLYFAFKSVSVLQCSYEFSLEKATGIY